MSPATPTGIHLQDYRVTGRNDFSLGPLCCNIAPGSFSCLVGPAQSGKSLLLASLCDLIPHQGQKRLLDEKTAAAQHRIQLIFQEGGLLENLSIAENLKLAQATFGHRDPQAQNELLERLNIAQTPSLFPHELSGGMRKRVLLARALLCRPTLLLIDNVTAGLDPQNAHKLMRLVLDFKKEHNFTLLWVTHEPGLIRSQIQQLLLLQNGQLIFDGPPSDAENQTTFQPYLQA